MKKNIHPKWFLETKVFCDGMLVMVTSSTKERLSVDSWSGNHPAYQDQDFVNAKKNPNVQLFLGKASKPKTRVY